MLDESFERLCLICSSSSSPSIIGPTYLHWVEIPPPSAICLPAALPVAPFSPCSILSTRTQSAEIPSEVGLPGTVWSSDHLGFAVLGRGQSFVEYGWECKMSPEAKQLI